MKKRPTFHRRRQKFSPSNPIAVGGGSKMADFGDGGGRPHPPKSTPACPPKPPIGGGRKWGSPLLNFGAERQKGQFYDAEEAAEEIFRNFGNFASSTFLTISANAKHWNYWNRFVVCSLIMPNALLISRQKCTRWSIPKYWNERSEWN